MAMKKRAKAKAPDAVAAAPAFLKLRQFKKVAEHARRNRISRSLRKRGAE